MHTHQRARVLPTTAADPLCVPALAVSLLLLLRPLNNNNKQVVSQVGPASACFGQLGQPKPKPESGAEEGQVAGASEREHFTLDHLHGHALLSANKTNRRAVVDGGGFWPTSQMNSLALALSLCSWVPLACSLAQVLTSSLAPWPAAESSPREFTRADGCLWRSFCHHHYSGLFLRLACELGASAF